MIFLLEEDRFICSRRDPFRGPNRDGPSLNGRQQRQWEAPHDEVEKCSPRATVADQRARPISPAAARMLRLSASDLRSHRRRGPGRSPDEAG
jgi:hypothetical protein